MRRAMESYKRTEKRFPNTQRPSFSRPDQPKVVSRVLLLSGQFCALGFRTTTPNHWRLARAEQNARRDAQGVGEIRQAAQREVDLATLDPLRVREIELCRLGQVLLSPAALEAKPLHIAPKLKHQFLRATRSRSWHVVDACDLSKTELEMRKSERCCVRPRTATRKGEAPTATRPNGPPIN